MEKILSRSRIHRDRFGVIHLSNHTNRHGYVQFLRILHLRRKTSEQCVRYVSILLQRRRAFRRVCVFLLPQQIFSEEEKTRRRKPSSRKRGAIIRFHRSNPTKATPPPNGTITPIRTLYIGFFSLFASQSLQATCTQYSSQYLRAASDERR